MELEPNRTAAWYREHHPGFDAPMYQIFEMYSRGVRVGDPEFEAFKERYQSVAARVDEELRKRPTEHELKSIPLQIASADDGSLELPSVSSQHTQHAAL
jgi:hypothetical protein